MNRLQSLKAGRRSTNVYASPSEMTTDGLLSMWQTWADGDGAERIGSDFASFVGSGYKANGIVFGLILARMSLFSEGTFAFQRYTDKGIFSTPALGILEEPWPNGSTGELLARMEQDVSLSGNAFIRLVPTAGRLERWRPDLVDILSNVTRVDWSTSYSDVVGYVYHRHGRASGRPADFATPDELAHWSPIPDPSAQHKGMSWLTAVVREVNADQQMTTHKDRFFKNAGTPNAWIKIAGKLTNKDRERLRRELELRHAGVENAGKTLIIDGGADYTTIGHSFEQMAFAAVQAAGENRIAVAANVPGIVAGLKEGLSAATYSNYEQAMRRFADLFGRPQWRSAAAALSRLVDVPGGSRLIVDVRDIAALKEGEKDRAEIFQKRAATVTNLVQQGFTPESATAAVTAGDLSLLQHTGLYPTTLIPPGSNDKTEV